MIRSFIQNPNYEATLDRIGKIFAAIGIVALSAATIDQIGPEGKIVIAIVLVSIWVTFCLEFLLRLFARSKDGPRYPLSIAGACDAMAVAFPAIGFTAGLDWRDVALLCGIWAVKFARGTNALTLLQRVLVNESRHLIGVMWIFIMVLFGAALLAHVLERETLPEAFGSVPVALWWAVTTLTTTGYGDAVPTSFGGRLLSGVVMTAGIGVFALWAGILAAGFAKEVRRNEFLRNWELVARVPLFAKLGAKELADIVGVLRARRSSAGSIICREGDPGEQMYFIVEGEALVSTVQPIRLGPGEHFGELALITGKPRTATVIATTAVSLLVLDISDYRVLVAHSPEMSSAINSEANRRLAALGASSTTDQNR